MIVDAAAMIELLVPTAKEPKVAAHLRDAEEGIDAPHLIDVEVAQALRRLVLHGELGEARAVLALDALAQFPVRRHAHTPLLPRLWLWRNTLSATDAAYVALAEVLDTPLVTSDVRLSKAAKGLVEVRVV